MEKIRLVDASLNTFFTEGTPQNEGLMKEFRSLLMVHDDPLSTWLKSEKTRKETEDTDKVLLTLIAELHRKVDALSLQLRDNGPVHLPLPFSEVIDGVGHGYFKFSQACLEEGKEYYARIDMPTFPRRLVPLFFEALSLDMAKIVLMHEDDKKDWSAYMVACERVMIRQMKGKESEY